jgi:hypothetical protein
VDGESDRVKLRCVPWPGAVPTSAVIRVGGSLYCLRCARPILADQAQQHEHVTPGAAAAHRRR